MTRTKVGLATALLLLVSACTTADQTSQPSTTPMLPPAGSIDPAYASKLSSQETTESSGSRTPAPTPTTNTAELNSSSAEPSAEPTPTVDPIGKFDASVGQGNFDMTFSDVVPESERPKALQAAELARDSLVLTDLLNQDLARTDLDEYLDDFYYGQLLVDRSDTVISSRANGRTQTGWFSGTLEVKEASSEAIWIEACLDASAVTILDAAGSAFPSDIAAIRAVFGVANYDVGQRISHLVFEPMDGTTCR